MYPVKKLLGFISKLGGFQMATFFPYKKVSHLQMAFFAIIEKLLQESRLPCFALCLGGKFAIML
jgi:hypothetical protein